MRTTAATAIILLLGLMLIAAGVQNKLGALLACIVAPDALVEV